MNKHIESEFDKHDIPAAERLNITKLSLQQTETHFKPHNGCSRGAYILTTIKSHIRSYTTKKK